MPSKYPVPGYQKPWENALPTQLGAAGDKQLFAASTREFVRVHGGVSQKNSGKSTDVRWPIRAVRGKPVANRRKTPPIPDEHLFAANISHEQMFANVRGEYCSR